jgi:coenzyme F420-0:L-glutamate ligase/coenzyme F420-1:gamma-L-glutamate ligase
MNDQKAAIYDVIEGRRSIRRFQPTPVEPEVLQRILQAATHAPSAHNRQPWRWTVVQREEVKRSLAESLAQALSRARRADGDDPAEIERDVRRSIERISASPVVLVLCLSMAEMDRYPDAERNQAEYLMAVQGVAMAGQNLMLSACAEGLGSCWMCAPLFSPESAHVVLDIPPDWVPQGMILLGYSSSPGREPVRKPMEAVVRWD